MNASAEVIVREVYPSLNEPPEWVFWSSGFMLISFIVGICGHASTLTTMLGFGRTKQRDFSESSSRKSCSIMWILCTLDLLAILSIPTAIIESLVGFWIFGSVMCKVHLLFYASGQTSAIVLAIWCANFEESSPCTKLPTKYRPVFKLATFILVALQSALMLSLTFNAEAVNVPIFFIHRTNTSDLQIRVFKCTTATYADFAVLWTAVEFTTLFVAPLVLICLVAVPTVFQPGYVNLRRQGTISSVTSNCHKGITKLRSAAQLAAIYAFCWLPFWISGIYQGRVLEWSPGSAQYSADNAGYETIVASVARVLPYAFVGCSWVFYNRVLNDGKNRRQQSTENDSYNPT